MAPGTAKVIDMDDFLSYGKKNKKKGNKFGDTLPETRVVSCPLEIETPLHFVVCVWVSV